MPQSDSSFSECKRQWWRKRAELRKIGYSSSMLDLKLEQWARASGWREDRIDQVTLALSETARDELVAKARSKMIELQQAGCDGDALWRELDEWLRSFDLIWEEMHHITTAALGYVRPPVLIPGASQTYPTDYHAKPLLEMRAAANQQPADNEAKKPKRATSYEAVQKAFWDWVEEHGDRPSQDDVAERLDISVDTLQRICRDDPRGWRPPRP